MVTIERFFSPIEPSGSGEGFIPKLISSYWDQKALVVLGDPGVGKTTSFKTAAEVEPNSIYATVRDFLILSDQYCGKTLYLDALDEQRAKMSDGSGVLDKIREKLNQLGCPSFRLSCRAADWYGDLDARSLSSVAPDGKVKVLKLEPLSETDIHSIVIETQVEPKSFIQKAKHQGIYELLKNPQTLRLLLQVVQDGQWPQSRSELFEKACHLLLKEGNPEHSHAPSHQFQVPELFNASGFLCAVQLCGGTAGFSLNQVESCSSFPWLGELEFNGYFDHLQAVARRRLFRADGPERVAPIHRTIAEYLAARFFVERINEGLPVRRIMALITGYDGGTLSDLRGLYAWLTCLCISHTDILIRHDPLGVILYGDVGVFSQSKKQNLFKCLDELAHRNPRFRVEYWAEQSFGALATKDMEPYFQSVLSGTSQHLVTILCVLDALTHGVQFPTLGDSLLSLIRDDNKPWAIRVQALSAYHNVCPDLTYCLKELLDDIHGGSVRDDKNQLRGDLLYILYPYTVLPQQVVPYLIPRNRHFSGSYTRFLLDHLVNATDPQDLPELIDSFVRSGNLTTNFDGVIRETLVGNLLVKALSHLGVNTPRPQLYEWLGLVDDIFNFDIRNNKDAVKITKWFQENPTIVKGLFSYWLTVVDKDRITGEVRNFWQRFLRVEPPVGFGQWLLGLAAVEADDVVAEFLLRQSIHFRTLLNRSDAPTLEEFYEFVGLHTRFQNVLESQLQCPIDDWRREQANTTKQQRCQLELKRESRVQSLQNSLDQIRSGLPSDQLIFLANLYFGKFSDVDHQLLPTARLEIETSFELKEAAFEGFAAALRKSPIADSAKIGEAHVQSEEYPFGYVILAGMDTLAASSMLEVMSLPEATLESALAFHFANLVEGSSRPWVSRLFIDHPRLASKALIAFWKPHLKLGASHIPGFYELPNREMAEIARHLCPSMLQLYPSCNEDILKVLLRASIHHVEIPDVLHIVRKVLSKRNGVRGIHRTLWYATAFALNPEEWNKKLAKYIGKDEKKAGDLLDFLFPSWPGENTFFKQSPKEFGELIEIAGKIFQPKDLEGNGWMGFDGIRGKAAGCINRLINRLSADPTSEATEVINGLRGIHSLDAWKDVLASACATQEKQRREANFQYPSVRKVLDTINGGRPANPADLQALVVDHFRTIAEDIRHGPTDGYKVYWNLDSHSRPTNPLPEEPCRDRILDRIKPILRTVGVEADPEGHYAQDKRSDIKVTCSPFNLPVEIKRHYHRDLWSAPTKQLKALYSRDPGTEGRGIYLVFWFGSEKKERHLPTPPIGINIPRTAQELEIALTTVIPEEDRELIRVIAIDCTINSLG